MANVDGMIDKLIVGLLGVVILFKVGADLIPEAQTAGDDLNSSGVPLGSLFTGSGVVFIMIMASLILGIYKVFKPAK